MVASTIHPAMDQIGTAAGNDLTATHIHGDSHHAMSGHSTRRDDGGNLSTTRLRVKIGTSTALSIQLGLWVIRVCSTTEERLKRQSCLAFNIVSIFKTQLLTLSF